MVERSHRRAAHAVTESTRNRVSVPFDFGPRQLDGYGSSHMLSGSSLSEIKVYATPDKPLQVSAMPRVQGERNCIREAAVRDHISAGATTCAGGSISINSTDNHQSVGRARYTAEMAAV